MTRKPLQDLTKLTSTNQVTNSSYPNFCLFFFFLFFLFPTFSYYYSYNVFSICVYAQIGEISLDEFERFFEVLIREWRASDANSEKRIQDQYRPLLNLYEPDNGIFGNNGDGQRKGFLRLMSRNGYVFWSDKPIGEALAAGHWSGRLGMDDTREAFELAASLQQGSTVEGGVAGTRCSRLAMLRFVRMHAPGERETHLTSTFKQRISPPPLLFLFCFELNLMFFCFKTFLSHNNSNSLS